MTAAIFKSARRPSNQDAMVKYFSKVKILTSTALCAIGLSAGIKMAAVFGGNFTKVCTVPWILRQEFFFKHSSTYLISNKDGEENF